MPETRADEDAPCMGPPSNENTNIMRADNTTEKQTAIPRVATLDLMQRKNLLSAADGLQRRPFKADVRPINQAPTPCVGPA